MTHEPQGEFRTLRGWFDGREPDEETYFHFSATIRILGDSLDLGGITDQLGVEPTKSHVRGERRGPRSPPFRQDMWSFTPDVPETEPLERHIDALWETFADRVDELRELKSRAKADVFLGYRSNCDIAGFEVPHTALKMFVELEIPFGVSIIIA